MQLGQRYSNQSSNQIVYIYRDILSVFEDVAQRKSMNESSEVKKTSTDFPCSGSREQWTLCRVHVNRNTVHARSALLTRRCVNKERYAKGL